MLHNSWELQISIKYVDTVLVGFWLEPKLLSLLVHPVNPVAALGDVECTRIVDAPIRTESAEAF